MFGTNQNAFFEKVLKTSLGNEVTLTNSRSIGGGCINNSMKLDTNEGPFFLKWNPSMPDDMFDAESKGLEILRHAGALKIPKVIAKGQIDGKHYLLLEHIEPGKRRSDYWEDYGRSMAALHKNHSNDKYGLDHDNYIGSLPQENNLMESWVSFFRDKRLEFQLKLALKQGLVDEYFADKFRSFYELLPGLLPENPPSLLHGDMWSGNVMVGTDGKVCLIDPAVYFGHREIELSFTQMFGGFDRSFYQAYNEAYPLDPGFDERISIYNMYPYMVHVNLFGRSYLSGVESVLSRYS